MIYDGNDVVLTPSEWDGLDHYEHSVPTSPSPGRIYRRLKWVFIVEDDPERIGWQVHRPFEPDISEHIDGTHVVDGHYFRLTEKMRLTGSKEVQSE